MDNKVLSKYSIEPTINKQEYTLPKTKEWNNIKDTGFKGDEETFKYAKMLIDNYGSFNLNGRAGTGKTTLTKNIIKYLKQLGKNIIALAPTHKAKNLIDG